MVLDDALLTSLTLADLADIGTILASVAAALGVGFVVWQLRYSQRTIRSAADQLRIARTIAKGDFLLRLEELLQLHNYVHINLRPGGAWTYQGLAAEGAYVPDFEQVLLRGIWEDIEESIAPFLNVMDHEDEVKLEMYMGLFERLNVLAKEGAIQYHHINQFYHYRMAHIVAHPWVRYWKLQHDPSAWTDFIELWCELKRERGEEHNLCR